MSSNKSDIPKNPPSQEDKARIMSTQSEKHGGQIPADSFASRIQSSADKHEAKHGSGGTKK